MSILITTVTKSQGRTIKWYVNCLNFTRKLWQITVSRQDVCLQFLESEFVLEIGTLRQVVTSLSITLSHVMLYLVVFYFLDIITSMIFKFN
jgi:hypothetical protein